MRRGQTYGMDRKGKEWMKKVRRYIYVMSHPHEEYNHHVLQTCSNRKLKINKICINTDPMIL